LRGRLPLGTRGGRLALSRVDSHPCYRPAVADPAGVAQRRSGRAPGARSDLRGDVPHPAHPLTSKATPSRGRYGGEIAVSADRPWETTAPAFHPSWALSRLARSSPWGRGHRCNSHDPTPSTPRS